MGGGRVKGTCLVGLYPGVCCSSLQKEIPALQIISYVSISPFILKDPNPKALYVQHGCKMWPPLGWKETRANYKGAYLMKRGLWPSMQRTAPCAVYGFI